MKDRPRALAVLISVFLAGCIIGASGFFLWAKKHPAPNAVSGNFQGGVRPGGPGDWPRQQEWFKSFFSQMLQLTPEQTRQMSQIMGERHDRLEVLDKKFEPMYSSVRAEHEPLVRAIIDDTNRRINDILNPEQQKKLANWKKEMEKRRGRGGPRRQGGGFGPPPPGRPPQF